MIIGKRKRPLDRGGFVVVGVMVCLALVIVLMGAAVKTLVHERQQLRDQHVRLQADYLAVSGLARAEARLVRDPAYQGETWTIEPAELGGPMGATISIQIETISGEPQTRRVRAIAEYPAGEPLRARRSSEKKINLPVSGASS